MAKVVFNEISIEIKTLLDEVKEEVKIAVAWFTNPFLFSVLEDLLSRQRQVKLIISDSEHNFGKLNFQKLIAKGAKVFVCKTISNKFMHNKFCIIDNRLAFSGSYNWSLNAETYFENIMVGDGEAVIKPLNIFFNKLLQHSVPFGSHITNVDESDSYQAKDDNRFYHLQQEFASAVQKSINETVAIGVNINTDNLYQMIDKYTAAGAAKLLASSKEGTNLQPGFKKLARRKRLDLTFEYLILLPQYQELFSTKVKEYAQRKLELGEIEAQLPAE